MAGPAQCWAGLGRAESVSGEEGRAAGPLPLRLVSRVLPPARQWAPGHLRVCAGTVGADGGARGPRLTGRRHAPPPGPAGAPGAAAAAPPGPPRRGAPGLGGQPPARCDGRRGRRARGEGPVPAGGGRACGGARGCGRPRVGSGGASLQGQHVGYLRRERGPGRLGVGSRFQGVNLEGAAPGSRGVGQGLGVPRKRAAGREGAERGSGCTSASRGRILKATCPKASSLHLKRQKGLNTIPSLPRGGLALRTLFRADLE